MTSSVAGLLDLVLELPALQQRQIGCLLGAVVGDAAARPLHWLYDLGQLQKAVASDPTKPEFWHKSHSPFYTLETGESSCYGDVARASLSSLAACRATLDTEHLAATFRQQFGPGSRYDTAARQEFMQLRAAGRPPGPLQGKWLHGAMLHFLQTGAGGPHIKETDGFCASLPVIVCGAGQPEMRERVERVAAMQSRWRVALRHAMAAAAILEPLLLGKTEPWAVAKAELAATWPEIAAEVEVVEELGPDHTAAVTRLGRPCYNPGSFLGALHAVLNSDGFESAVRQTILAGGCNCSRAFLAGAVLGARDGVAGIPRDWVLRTREAETVIRLAMAITSVKQPKQ